MGEHEQDVGRFVADEQPAVPQRRVVRDEVPRMQPYRSDGGRLWCWTV
jgi:hypothetical protein